MAESASELRARPKGFEPQPSDTFSASAEVRMCPL